MKNILMYYHTQDGARDLVFDVHATMLGVGISITVELLLSYICIACVWFWLIGVLYVVPCLSGWQEEVSHSQAKTGR